MGQFITGVLIAAILVIAFVAIRSYVKKLNSGCCGTGGEKVKSIKVADRDKSHYPYTATLDVDGMVCANCAHRVENALNTLDGVWASVDLSAHRATVRMKQPLADDLLRTTVNGVGGYTVMKISR